MIGKDFIQLWLGNNYIDAYYGITLVIIPGLFFNSLQIANTALVVQNKVKIQAILTLIIGVINVICSFILSHYFGVIGASISIFIAYTIRAIAMHFICYKTLKLDIMYFIRQCYGRNFFSIIITLIIGVLVNIIFVQLNWVTFIIKGIIVVITYFITFVFLSTTKNEKKIIKKVLSQKILKLFK